MTNCRREWCCLSITLEKEKETGTTNFNNIFKILLFKHKIFYLFISEQSSNLSVHFTLISHLATCQVLKTVCAFVTILDNADLKFFFPILTYWFRGAVRSIAQKTLVHSSNLACGPDFVWARGWAVFIFKRLLIIQRNV